MGYKHKSTAVPATPPAYYLITFLSTCNPFCDAQRGQLTIRDEEYDDLCRVAALGTRSGMSLEVALANLQMAQSVLASFRIMDWTWRRRYGVTACHVKMKLPGLGVSS